MNRVSALFVTVNCLGISVLSWFVFNQSKERFFIDKTLSPSLMTDEGSSQTLSPSSMTDEGSSPTSVNVSIYYLLVVVILSPPNGTERRNAIRKTWIKGYQERPQGVLVKFSIGISGLSEQALSNLANEQENFNDLMLLHNVYDSYSNLTKKVLNSFVYANSNYKFFYILKSDDDSFLSLDVILEELAERKSNQSYYWGYIIDRAIVHTEGKYAEHKWFLSNNYLPYAQGIAYVLSGDLIRYLTVNPDKLMLYNNEDVSVGAWISPYNVERRHDKRFIYYYRRCRRDGIVFNPVSIPKMHKMYKNYIRIGTVC